MSSNLDAILLIVVERYVWNFLVQISTKKECIDTNIVISIKTIIRLSH